MAGSNKERWNTEIFTLYRTKCNADRAHHVAQCLTGSWLLWGVFISKIKDATSSVTCQPYSFICFLESQQHYWPNASLWHVLLVPEDRVTHDWSVLTHVPRGPRWHKEPGPCFPDPDTQTCATGPSWLQPPWRAPLRYTGPTKHLAEGNHHNRHHINWWRQPIPGDKVVIIKSSQSSKWHVPIWDLAASLRPWRSSELIARKDQSLAGASPLWLVLTKGRRQKKKKQKPKAKPTQNHKQPSLCHFYL